MIILRASVIRFTFAWLVIITITATGLATIKGADPIACMCDTIAGWEVVDAQLGFAKRKWLELRTVSACVASEHRKLVII
jgi:hypothetical protein